MRLARTAWAQLTGLRKKMVNYVTDDEKWSFSWDAHYITHGLRERRGLRAKITAQPWKIRGQILHFGDRYMFFDGYRRLHQSNEVFLSWFHGDADDPNPIMQDMLIALRNAAPCIRKIVVPCSISRDVLLNQGLEGSKLATIPLGVELKRFQPPLEKEKQAIRDMLGIPAGAVCIGSFQKDGSGWGAGMEPKWVKGPDTFLEVVAGLKKTRQNLFVLLTGPARGYMIKGLEERGVPYKHCFLKSYHEIVSFYQALDLYIVTSRSEGGPKALLESWATGVPIVSTRVGMCADLIRPSENGMLADVDNVEDIVTCAEELLQSAELRKRCIYKALQSVRKYDWSLIAERYCDELYREALL